MTMKIRVTSIVLSFLVLIAFCDLCIFGYKITSRLSETSKRSNGDENFEKVENVVKMAVKRTMDDAPKEEKQMVKKVKDAVDAVKRTLDELGSNDEKNVAEKIGNAVEVVKKEVSKGKKDDKQESKKIKEAAIKAIIRTAVREKVTEALDDESKNNTVVRIVKMAIEQILDEEAVAFAYFVKYAAEKKLAEGASDEKQGKKMKELVEKDKEKLDGVSKGEQRKINKGVAKQTDVETGKSIKNLVSRMLNEIINNANNRLHYSFMTLIMVAVRQKVFEALQHEGKGHKVAEMIVQAIKQKLDEEPGKAKNVTLKAEKILARRASYEETRRHNFLDDIKPEKFHFAHKTMFNAVKDKLDDALNEKHNNVKGIVRDAVQEAFIKWYF